MHLCSTLEHNRAAASQTQATVQKIPAQGSPRPSGRQRECVGGSCGLQLPAWGCCGWSLAAAGPELPALRWPAPQASRVRTVPPGSVTPDFSLPCSLLCMHPVDQSQALLGSGMGPASHSCMDPGRWSPPWPGPGSERWGCAGRLQLMRQAVLPPTCTCPPSKPC